MWEARLDSMEAECPGVREDVVDVDCGEYPCMLVVARTGEALQQCGLGGVGEQRTMQSALDGKPFTAVLFSPSGDSSVSEAIGNRMTTRFGQLWQIEADASSRD